MYRETTHSTHTECLGNATRQWNTVVTAHAGCVVPYSTIHVNQNDLVTAKRL